jgi:P27 family predicted phage terminase small subunit
LPVAVKELSPANGIPALPAGVGRAGTALWESVWLHAQAWISPDLDLGTVEMAVMTRDFVEQCRSAINADGLTLKEPIVTPTGELVGERLVAHPLIKEQRAAEKQLERWLSLLALTPTDRARLGLAQVKQQSVLEKLIDARGRPATITATARTR